MTSYLHDDVIPMPAISMNAIESLGENVVAVLRPHALERPMPIDVLGLVEFDLPQHGIHVTPTSAEELDGRLAATSPEGDDDIDILLDEDLWDALLCGGKVANRSRATVVHELAHAILHVPVIRRRRRLPESGLLLSRVARGEIPAYRDCEWQAWALSGCILAPRKTILAASARSVEDLADTFEVSAAFMRSHLRRLKVLGRYES